MKGAFLNKILRIDAKHALYRSDGKWYHNLKKFPGVLFDENGLVLFPTKKAYFQNSNLQIKQDLHVIGGISKLPEYQFFSPFQVKLINGISIEKIVSNQDSNESIRVIREVNAILRKQSLVKKIKRLYNNTCQICGNQLKIGKQLYYSEVHHIIPLGNPYHGKDELANMICVCPNHHVQLDLKAIPIDKESLYFMKHEISSDYIDHHNLLVDKLSKA